MLATPYIPLDGINDAGVGIGIYMTYQGKDKTVPTNQNSIKPDITSTTFIRLILDYADNVEEAIELAAQYDMHDSANTSYHFMVADKSGKSAILEWIGNTDLSDNDGSKRNLKATRNDKNYQVVTNFIVKDGYYSSNKEAKGYDRYEYLKKHLENNKGIVNDEQAAMDLLKGVGRRTWVVEGDATMGTTVHSVVYNLSDLSSYWIANEHYDSNAHTFKYQLNK